jgi:mannose-6-phosphate isomerase-like protein (cupin superfamily)
MVPDELRARYRTHDQIRSEGAIGNLADGVEITTQDIRTRLIAWPGTGYQTESVHVLTVEPGQESRRYCYELAEEALLCHKGCGEVWLRGGWVPIEPGDMAYFPEGVVHAVRNPARTGEQLVLVSQITPPQFDLYADHGLYNAELGVMNYDSVHKACTNARPQPLSTDNVMAFHDGQREHRAWNLDSRTSAPGARSSTCTWGPSSRASACRCGWFSGRGRVHGRSGSTSPSALTASRT